MTKVYGVSEGVPYDKWPTEALQRLQGDLGRNGDLGQEGSHIVETVTEVLKGREGVSVDYDSDGNLHHGV